MKFHTLSSTLLLGALLLGVSSLSARPQVEVTPKLVQLGDIAQQGEPVSFEYSVVNSGDSPLLIQFVRTSCSCTKATYTRRPVMPGDTTAVVISYDPRRQPTGALRRVVSIITNTTPSESKVLFKGRVLAQ